jgi:hypothetical protein
MSACLRFACGILLLVGAGSSIGFAKEEPSVEELKARLSAANTGDKVKICVQIAEKQLVETDRLYEADDMAKGQSALTDVVSYSELARDYSIQARKHQKQTEIAVRTMSRKLNELLHALSKDEQAPVRDAIDRLEKVRDDLLASMFPKGAK